jgi:CBS domain containing-hemolysin-like protein
MPASSFSEDQVQAFIRDNKSLFLAITETIPLVARVLAASATLAVWIFRAVQPGSVLLDTILFYLIGVQVCGMVIPSTTVRRHPLLSAMAVTIVLTILERYTLSH